MCPDEAPGYYPNCRCELGRHFDKERRICTVVNRSGCPAKSTGKLCNRFSSIES